MKLLPSTEKLIDCIEVEWVEENGEKILDTYLVRKKNLENTIKKWKLIIMSNESFIKMKIISKKTKEIKFQYSIYALAPFLAVTFAFAIPRTFFALFFLSFLCFLPALVGFGSSPILTILCLGSVFFKTCTLS